jgi:hypothetical protein
MSCRTLAIIALLPAAALAAEPRRQEPEERSLVFLAREVPGWSRQNHCFSCHNNGDAAQALYAGLRAGFSIPRTAVADTSGWLSDPHRWEHNGGAGPFSDKRLARVQFTAALATASRTGQVNDPQVLIQAAARLAHDQSPDGSWPLDGEDEPGSPATYGRFLATYLAREGLKAADPVRFRQPIDRSGRWLSTHEAKSLMDVSVSLMVSVAVPSPRALQSRAHCLGQLRKGQSDDGGWGPFATSPPEIFDTALALIALAGAGNRAETRDLITRGRGFLIARQQPDGSWIETNRPPGARSYAQRISTTAWATLALLATRDGASPGLRLDLNR